VCSFFAAITAFDAVITALGALLHGAMSMWPARGNNACTKVKRRRIGRGDDRNAHVQHSEKNFTVNMGAIAH
jgi:hypothetical protein